MCYLKLVIIVFEYRKRLSQVSPLFDFDFQHFNPATGHFGYTCLIMEVTQDGLVDSVGLWFNLYMDHEKTLVLSNAPFTATSETSPVNETCPEQQQAQVIILP